MSTSCYFTCYSRKCLFHLLKRHTRVIDFDAVDRGVVWQIYVLNKLMIEYANRHFRIVFDRSAFIVPRVHYKKKHSRWVRTTRREKLNLVIDAIHEIETSICIFCKNVASSSVCGKCSDRLSDCKMYMPRPTCPICLELVTDPIEFECVRHAGCIGCVLEYEAKLRGVRYERTLSPNEETACPFRCPARPQDLELDFPFETPAALSPTHSVGPLSDGESVVFD